MSLFGDHVEHAQNPPSTWAVVKIDDRKWALRAGNGVTLSTFPRRMDADTARQMGWWVDLYAKEADWYAGKTPNGWKPYGEVRR